MSVGAGSIKRAAKAANAAGKNNAAEQGNALQEDTKKESKNVAAKSVGAKKGTVKKTSAAKVGNSASKEKAEDGAKAAKAAGEYVAYGVGQELPIYLM